jgi:hypothetical protein
VGRGVNIVVAALLATGVVAASANAARTSSPPRTPPKTTNTGSDATATTASAPAAPRSYSVPADALKVSTAAQLSSALSQSTAQNIVLADGTYGTGSAFSNANGHHLFAAHVGKAVLTVGIVLGGNYGNTGGSIQGLAFDITNANAVDDNSIVDVWGAMGVDTAVRDTTINGHSVVGYAINVNPGEGFVAQRIVASNFTSDGISIDSYPDPVTFTQRPQLTDINVSYVSRPTPRSSDGTSEACLWLGTPVTLQRAKLRNCAWDGLWTGFNGTGSTYQDVDVDSTPIGVYMEHFTTSSIFNRLHVGSGVRTGVNCEWDDPSWGSKPASVDNLIENSVIQANRVGVYMDEGTTGTVVKNSTFKGESAAAIVDYKGVGNRYSGNNYSGIAKSAVAVSKSHL